MSDDTEYSYTLRGRAVTVHGSDPHGDEPDTGVGVGYDNVWVTDDETGEPIDLTPEEDEQVWNYANQCLAGSDWGWDPY